jgi:two-component system, OmpR family, phosphate regulon sensor histidine kinase PhoR
VRLGQRLLFGALVVVAVLVGFLVISLDRRLHTLLRDATQQDLLREARAVADRWEPGIDSDSLADRLGSALARRVTLIVRDGRVIGDSEFDGAALASLENHATRPEVAAAIANGQGTSVRPSPSAGDEELYAAVRASLGIARVSMSTRMFESVVNGTMRQVWATAALGVLLAASLALLFARSIARPVLALRDDARALAAGDLARRPSLAAPGELGELATAFHRLAEQLSARLQALEADEVLFHAVTESLNEGVIAIDARQHVVRINETATKLLGLRDVVPFPVDHLPRDRIFQDAIAAALRGTPTEDVETQINERTLALTALPLGDGGAVLALLDLTPVRKLEAVRRDFVANVSHELRTPLTVIGGFAETLADPDVPPAQRQQFAEAILSNTRRMQRLVDDLLDLSRIESGGWRPNPARIDLQAMAHDTLAAVRRSAVDKGLELREDIHSDASELVADPTAVRQILGNLVDNAIRYTSTGSVTIFARRDNGAVVLGVRDTGSGIPVEHLPRVFERFYRVDTARSRAAGGTGLGLSIVRHLVEAHGGRVRAESAPGQGTTIFATFPLVGGIA